MNKYPAIELYKGATSVLDIDLSEFDFQGGKVVFTMKDKFRKGAVMKKEFDTQDAHQIVFDTQFTEGLAISDARYEYDLMWHIGDARYPQCAPSPVVVLKTVGGSQND